VTCDGEEDKEGVKCKRRRKRKEEKKKRFTAFRETPSVRTPPLLPNHITRENFYLWLMEFT